LVFQKFLSEGYSLLGHRLQTPFAEIDLLFGRAQGPRNFAVAVEVKSNSSDAFLLARVGPRQKTKLRQARVFLEQQFSQVQLLLAVVSHDASIDVFENF